MQAMTFMLPLQTLQVSTSIANTRFKRCALAYGFPSIGCGSCGAIMTCFAII